MPSLKDNIATLARAEIAKRAEVEAAVLAGVIDARAARDACAKEVDARKALLAGLEAKALDTLPDEDAAIREHLIAVDVAKSRVKIAEKKLSDAQTALAAAQTALAADESGAAPEFEKASRELEQIAENFDEEFPAHAEAIIRLIEGALEIERRAHPSKEKTTSVGRAVRAVRELLGGSTTLRLELVDKGGAVLWRGDQTTTSSTDVAR